MFTSVFAEHHGACLRIARRLVRDEGLAHDVVQDVFLSWWRTGGGGYRPDRGELAPWLSTLTHHKAVDALRSADRQRRILGAVQSTRSSEPEQRLVDEVVWWELGRQSLMAALPTLPPKQREVLNLAYTVGLSQAEIAERLGIPLGTVKSRTHAGMLRLRAALSGTWTPAGWTVTSAPASADAPTVVPSVRALADAGRADPAPRTVSEDVEQCVRDLVEIAAEETDRARDAAVMASRAGALADTHGDAAAYVLGTLARLAVPANPGARSSPEPSPSAAGARGTR